MKTFTIKDFILYNSTCFICYNKTIFSPLNKRVTGESKISYHITNNDLVMVLKTSYNGNLNLYIDLLSNTFKTSNYDNLGYFLFKNDIYLKSFCNNCQSSICSEKIEFDLYRLHIKPFSLLNEMLYFNHNNIYYSVISDFIDNKTIIISDSGILDPNISKIELPLMPLYILKTKQKLIESISVYTLFS